MLRRGRSSGNGDLTLSPEAYVQRMLNGEG
jgi:hypothetical protein